MKLKKELKNKWLKILVGFAITIVALWLSFRKLDWQLAKETFLQVNFFWVILAVANTIFIAYALGWRWQILLKPKDKIALFSLFRMNIISQYVNIIIPGRFGEVLRAYLASKQYKVSGAYVMGTIAIEKIFDFFVFAALWVLAPAFFAMQKEVKEYKIALFFCLLSVSFLALFIWQPETFLKWISSFSRLFPTNFRQKFINFFEKGIESFGQLRSVKTLLFIIVLTLGFIGGQVLTNYFLFKAFHLNLSFWVSLILLLALQVGTLPPSTPGKIGVFEYAVILALSVFDISKSQALSYGIMLHVVAYLPKIIFGMIFIAQSDIRLKQRKK